MRLEGIANNMEIGKLVSVIGSTFLSYLCVASIL